MPEKPNILYIHSHDTGRAISPYGYAVDTPNLMNLARGGVLFRNAYCAGPTCSPSRAALLTGQTPHSAGMLGLAHRGFALHDYHQHLVHTLHRAGYETSLAGVQHVAAERDSRGREAWETIGYDLSLGEAERAHETAAAYLRERAGSEKPFFLSVGFVETHREFPELEDEEEARYVQPPRPLPDIPAVRTDFARYKRSVAVLDEKVGHVLRALEESGLSDDTLVVSTTDHGIAFPRMKCSLTDDGIGVSLIMRGPGEFSGGRVVDALVSQIDLFPTLCELLGIEPPGWLQGKSMMPILRGEAAEVNEAVFAEVNFHAAYEPMRCVRTHRYKYIIRFDGRSAPVLPNVDDGESKTALHEQGWFPVEEEALYDLAFDPNESRNRASDPDSAAVLSELRATLEGWMERTADPLLPAFREGGGSTGRARRAAVLLKPPRGAVLNDPDGQSPNESPRTWVGI